VRVSRSRAAIAVATLLIAWVGASLTGAERPRFSLGVLRRDGVLLPFAGFDGHAWSLPWPDPASDVPMPITLADVPAKWFGPLGPGATWTAWFPEAAPRPLKIDKLAHVPVFCSAHLGLATDYRGAEFDPREPTVPKDALAVSGSMEVGPITAVSIHAADAARIVSDITERFNETEQAAANAFSSWKHPWTAEERAGFPIEIEAFYRAMESRPGGTEFRTSYVEVVRRFPARPGDRGCGLITYARGWVTDVAGKKPVVSLSTRVTYCDREGVTFMQPLGRLRIDKDSYWVYQLSSWRDEVYGVSRVSQDGVKSIVAISGGFCPKEPRR